MGHKKVTFKNSNGEKLIGYLDLPINQKPHDFAIFAHCFTCSKNLKTVSNISKSLTQKGFGVLRFDFTGLGESSGDFSDTNFSGNVEDLKSAAEFLKQNYKAPTLLVGHSLGGAASLLAAKKISSIQAVATIAAPSEPSHVKKLFEDDLDTIKKEGKAKVKLAGRTFTIKKSFVDDLLDQTLLDCLKELRKPLLILHSPQDKIVGIDNAEKIYTAAFHPKSFITLDGADHLLSNQDDAFYTGNVIAQWAWRYLDIDSEQPIKSDSAAAASLDNEDMFTTAMKIGKHSFMADEPKDSGGNDFGPNPYEFLCGALAACKSMTLQMYAQHKKINLENVTVHVDHLKEYKKDCENCEDNDSKIDTFTCKISLEGDLNKQQKQRLLEIADKCPVHKTLTSAIQIHSKLKG